MKTCSVCKKEFDPELRGQGPAVEMGEFLGENVLRDGEELCPTCLENRGMLGMMYCRNMD
ncbi:MAG: hypothetical protein C0615_03840 [Desulfuromonas sp.]|nr:MAG: hypothetical protein C0615_03840 [Desulfuromonas sp.]